MIDGHTDTQTHRHTQATTIPEGQNWPRVKTTIRIRSTIRKIFFEWYRLCRYSNWAGGITVDIPSGEETDSHIMPTANKCYSTKYVIAPWILFGEDILKWRNRRNAITFPVYINDLWPLFQIKWASLPHDSHIHEHFTTHTHTHTHIYYIYIYSVRYHLNNSRLSSGEYW